MTETRKSQHPLSLAAFNQESSAPLAVFRIIFGTMMLLSIIRFWSKGWIEELYIKPTFHFTYLNFEWVQSLGTPGMYILFASCAIFAIGIATGFLYRLSAIGFFLSFTYIELIDKTTYLNHYYFVSLVAFLLIFLPANRRFAADIKLGLCKATAQLPRLYRLIIMAQLGIVYFFAGLAKLNSDWLLEAQPMTIWLKAFGHWPVIGQLFDANITAYLFSWSGAIFDLSIPFLLYFNRSRPYAYAAVVFFHITTAIMFPIGMFPFIMIVSTLIFFPAKIHERVLTFLGEKKIEAGYAAKQIPKMATILVAVFFAFQLIFPFRYALYPGELFWHEQGYRFSWRVMLMEKTGAAFFYVQGNDMARPLEIRNSDYLTPLQEKMMATQPDMILEYAHFLKKEYEYLGHSDIEVKAKVYVTLNGRSSRLFIDPDVNLASQKKSWKHKDWILPFNEEIRGL